MEECRGCDHGGGADEGRKDEKMGLARRVGGEGGVGLVITWIKLEKNYGIH